MIPTRELKDINQRLHFIIEDLESLEWLVNEDCDISKVRERLREQHNKLQRMEENTEIYILV